MRSTPFALLAVALLAAATPAAARDAPPAPSAPPEVLGQIEGQWEIGDIANEAQQGLASAILGNRARLGASTAGTPYYLGIRCYDGEIDLLVEWWDVIAEAPLPVEVVAGSGGRRLDVWWLSSTRTGTFYPQDARAFVESLYDEGHLIVRLLPDGGLPITAVFDIEGIESKLANVRAACGW